MPDPLSGLSSGTPFIELQSVDSTNNYARSMISKGLARHGTVIFSHEQLQGKGQRGKSWHSAKDSSILLSVIVDPAFLELTQQFHLIACTALASQQFLENRSGESIHIKWPNDLYWQDRKAGGILIESVVGSQSAVSRQSSAISLQPSAIDSQHSTVDSQQQGNWKWAIIGIGININQISFPSELKNPVSLKQITGKHSDVVNSAKDLCTALDLYLNKLASGGFEKIYEQYSEHLYKKDEAVKFKKGSRVFQATVKGVSPSGQLITQHTIEERFDFGDIEWVI